MARPGALARLGTAVSATLALAALLFNPAPHDTGAGRVSGTAGPRPVTTLASAGRTCVAKALLPAYFYPGPIWRVALAAAGPGQAIILNPDNGPGGAPDHNYVLTAAHARATGARLLGYIDTRYARVSQASIAKQIAEYRNWYDITNIFFDDVTSAGSQVGYYRAASEAVRSADPRARIVLNPGTYPAPAYASLGDTLVVFEGDERSFLSSPPPAWMASYPPSTFAMIVSAVAPADEAAITALAVRRGAGYVYVTDHIAPSTLYEQLPTYWSRELRRLRESSVCSAADTRAPKMGYWVLTGNGAVEGYGTAIGSATVSPRVARATAGLDEDPTRAGFWLATRNGHIYQEGGAPFLGSPVASGRAAGNSIVGIASAPSCNGYWVATSNGHVFNYGCATPVRGARRRAQVDSVAANAHGPGLWLATSNGHVYQEGGAPFFGSPVSRHRRVGRTVVGLAPDPVSSGYWVLTSTGHVFNYGGAPFAGSPVSRHQAVGHSVVGMAATPDGRGYWVFTRTGGVLRFGDALGFGSPAATVVAAAPSP